MDQLQFRREPGSCLNPKTSPKKLKAEFGLKHLLFKSDQSAYKNGSARCFNKVRLVSGLTLKNIIVICKLTKTISLLGRNWQYIDSISTTLKPNPNSSNLRFFCLTLNHHIAKFCKTTRFRFAETKCQIRLLYIS